MKGTGKFVGGLVLGAALGMAAGLLVAPTSGIQIRNTILRRSRKYSRQAIDAVRQYMEGIKQGRVQADPELSQRDTEEILNRLEDESNS